MKCFIIICKVSVLWSALYAKWGRGFDGPYFLPWSLPLPALKNPVMPRYTQAFPCCHPIQLLPDTSMSGVHQPTSAKAVAAVCACSCVKQV